MEKNLQQKEWEESYERGENHVFYPSDEVIRFVSKNLRKRVGLDKTVPAPGREGTLKVLDLGCGMGRNMVFGRSMGLEMYGIELSEVAVNKAKDWLARDKSDLPPFLIERGSVAELPWPENFFDCVISDSALDSMHFDVAKKAVQEVARTLKPGCKFYFNLIGEQNKDGQSIVKEEIVATLHEKGTVQSYFDFAKIQQLLSNDFEIEQCELHAVSDQNGKPLRCRWNVVSSKK